MNWFFWFCELVKNISIFMFIHYVIYLVYSHRIHKQVILSLFFITCHLTFMLMFGSDFCLAIFHQTQNPALSCNAHMAHSFESCILSQAPLNVYVFFSPCLILSFLYIHWYFMQWKWLNVLNFLNGFHWFLLPSASFLSLLHVSVH